MAQIKEVSGTAFVVAQFRAEENTQSPPLYQDPIVEMAETVIDKTTGDAGVTRLVESFADMGAPWITGIRDVRSLARELRLTLIETVKSSDLSRAYWPDRGITSPIFDYYSLCTVAS